MRHSVAGSSPASGSRIPKLRLSESPPKLSRNINELTFTKDENIRKNSNSSEDSGVVTARNLRRSANEYLKSNQTALPLECRDEQAKHVNTVPPSLHPSDYGDNMDSIASDNEPKTFIVSCPSVTELPESPQAVAEAREDREVTAEEDLERTDNNEADITTDNILPTTINPNPTMYQSTVRQILTPYTNFFPQSTISTNTTVAIETEQSKTTLDIKTEDNEKTAENVLLVQTSSDNLIRRSSGSMNDEYITLNLGPSPVDTSHPAKSCLNSSEEGKHEKNVEKFSNLEPIYECYSSGKA